MYFLNLANWGYPTFCKVYVYIKINEQKEVDENIDGLFNSYENFPDNQLANCSKTAAEEQTK